MAVLVTTPSYSDTSVTTSADSVQATSMSLPPESAKSPGIATMNSFMGTAAPLAVGIGLAQKHGGLGLTMGMAGFLVGPSLGHVYADNGAQAFTGIAIRSACVAVCAVGMATLEDSSDRSGILIGTSLMVGTISVLGDIFSAGRSATSYNRRVARDQQGLRPIVVPVGKGGYQAALVMTF